MSQAYPPGAAQVVSGRNINRRIGVSVSATTHSHGILVMQTRRSSSLPAASQDAAALSGPTIIPWPSRRRGHSRTFLAMQARLRAADPYKAQAPISGAVGSSSASRLTPVASAIRSAASRGSPSPPTGPSSRATLPPHSALADMSTAGIASTSAPSPLSSTSSARTTTLLLRPSRTLRAASRPAAWQAAASAGRGAWAPTTSAASVSSVDGFGGGDGGDNESDIEIPEFMEPSVYDAAMNNQYWETRPVRVIARLLRIALEFGGWAAATRARNLGLRDTAAREVAAAEALKDVLVRLGPAFVKIGQALSSRPDVLPPPYIAALEALQDRIPPFPDAAAMAVLESELGAPPSALFSRLTPRPVAAASLGQVYRGALRPELGGAEVAVKVQRPRVAQMIAQDVYILRILAGWLRTARRLNTDLPALVDEWASSLFRELNYRTEADNARRFKELFSHLPQVYVPHIYGEFTTAKILTMEWIDGERLRTAGTSATERAATSTSSSNRQPYPATPPSTSSSNRQPYPATPPSTSYRSPPPPSSSPRSPGGGRSFSSSQPSSPSSSSSSTTSSPPLDPRRLEDLALVEVGVRCSLEQMLEEGFYHADPHPGNLLRTPDSRLAYLDFGMMGQIDERTRNALMTATLHLVNREYGRLAEDFITLGFLPPGTDREAVLPALTEVFTEALRGGVSNLSFGQLSGNLGVTMYKYSFRIPPYYTLFVRSLSVLEGIALAADPNYKVLGSAYPWIARRLLTDPSPDLRAALRRLLYTPEGRFRFDRLESLLLQAAKSASRLKRPQQQSQGQTTTPFTSSPSAGDSGSAGGGGGGGSGGGGLQLLLSRDGEFVRDILLDEVAKGIDGAWRIAADAAVATVRQRVAALSPLAAPLLTLLHGGPLMALFTATTTRNPVGGGTPGAADGDGGVSGGGPVSVQQALTAALARLPALATADDRTQVAGLVQLGNALADVAGLKVHTILGGGGGGGSANAASDGSTAGTAPAGAAADASSGGGGGGGGLPLPHLPASPSELHEAAAEAAEALRWLAREAGELPEEARGELLQLPVQLGARVASRVTARALRAVVLSGPSSPSITAAAPEASQDGGSSSGSTADGTTRTAATATASTVAAAGAGTAPVAGANRSAPAAPTMVATASAAAPGVAVEAAPVPVGAAG